MPDRRRTAPSARLTTHDAVGSGGEADNRPPAPVTRAVALSLAVPLFVAVVLTLFVWPSLRAEPHGLDVAVVGSSTDVRSLQTVVDAAQPGAFDLVPAPTASAAMSAVVDRDVVGALVPGQPWQILVAGAGGATLAQSVQSLGVAVSEETSTPPVVRDVTPLPAGDPRGIVLAGGLLPLILAGIALGAVLGGQQLRAGVRVLAVLIGASVSGLLLVAVMQTWLNALGGNYLMNASAVALAVAAVALPVLGLRLLLGTLGIAVAALTMVVVGNPLSGSSTSPMLLPPGAAHLGQILPPGATATLLRSTSGFDGAHSLLPASVLAGWVLAGLVLSIIAARGQSSLALASAAATAATADAAPHRAQ